MSEPKFTGAPWRVRARFMDKAKKWERISIWANAPIPYCLIAEMPDPTYCNPEHCAEADVIHANANLIAATPDLYANEEKNLMAFKEYLEFYKSALPNLNAVAKKVVQEIINGLNTRIAETEQILAKARGEKTNE